MVSSGVSLPCCRGSRPPDDVLIKRFWPGDMQELTNPIGGIVFEPEFVGNRHDAMASAGKVL